MTRNHLNRCRAAVLLIALIAIAQPHDAFAGRRKGVPPPTPDTHARPDSDSYAEAFPNADASECDANASAQYLTGFRAG